MNELKIEIVELEERIEKMEARLDEANSPEEAEELASMLELMNEDLQALQEEYEQQRDYDSMDAWQYNGISQKDFY